MFCSEKAQSERSQFSISLQVSANSIGHDQPAVECTANTELLQDDAFPSYMLNTVVILKLLFQTVE
jgi:hypothetical protein